MSFSLKNKNALITGATAGIGLAVAKRFIAHDANVIISGRRGEGETIARDIGAHFIQADLCQESQVESLFSRAQAQLGELHIVVNNAGCAKNGALIAEQNLADFDALFQLNVRAAYQVLQLAARLVVPGGCIINTASIAAFHGAAYGAAYYASKATLVSLTKTAAIELASQGIRVNAVSPGLINSEIWQGTSPDAFAKRSVPMQRVGEADEAAAVFHFLASDESSYVTGANYLVDGGFCAGAVMGTADD